MQVLVPMDCSISSIKSNGIGGVPSSTLGSEPPSNATGIRANENGLKTTQSKSQLNRFHLQGTGRVAFGSTSDVRAVFVAAESNRGGAFGSTGSTGSKETVGTGSSKNSSAGGRFDALGASADGVVGSLALAGGIHAARLKMERWGEEWADEEDLPSSWAEVDSDSAVVGGNTELGIKAASGGLGRDVALASQRLHKLKIAKKNSKFK